MADIATVLKKTIDGLPDNTPVIREKVYTKARAAVRGKLEAKEPAPDEATIDRQMMALGKIIDAIESEYSFTDQVSDMLGVEPPASAPLDDPQPSAPDPLSPEPARQESEPATIEPDQPVETETAVSEPSSYRESTSADAGSRAETVAAVEEMFDPAAELPLPKAKSTRAAGGSKRTALIPALVTLAIVLVIGGAGYAGWVNRDAITEQVNSLVAGISQTDEPIPAEAPIEPAPAAEPDAQSETAGGPEAEAGTQKFTQRLQPDGTEIDAGPAGGAVTTGEGTSVAQATTGEVAPGNRNASESTGEAQETDPETPAEEATVAVGQQAIFYEERTTSEQGRADRGSVVWSQIEESPGGDLPPEPAIRADVTIPERDIGLRLTIRRNGDDTLPASHIIELVFTAPDDFAGGAVEEVLRVNFKSTEQAPGNPLLGIPVKIADDFFLVALTDGKAEIDANTTLMNRLAWVDVPIVYKTGRRALVTMEKGIPGDAVFDSVLKAWADDPPAGG